MYMSLSMCIKIYKYVIEIYFMQYIIQCKYRYLRKIDKFKNFKILDYLKIDNLKQITLEYKKHNEYKFTFSINQFTRFEG